MNWSITFAPLVPNLVLIALAAVAIGLVIALLVRRSRGALLRLAALAALIGALLNPILKEEQRESLDNVAIVVLDESPSQKLSDRTKQLEAIRSDIEAKFAKIPNLKIKWVNGGVPGEQTAPGTNLFTDLNAALSDTAPDRIAGVVFVSDGQVHDVPKSAAALGFDAPVHTLLTGKPDEFDRRIEIIEAPRYGLVGQSRPIELAVRETGKAPTSGSGAVTLKVRREGQPDETVRTEIGRKVTVDMPIPHTGTNIVEIELAPTPGELTTANNRAVVAAEGVRENLRVLLVSGEPHPGERTWRNLLKSDAAVDLVHFTILRPPEKQDGTPINQLSLIAFPTRELFSEKINEFDLIIFDRYEHRGILQLLYYDNIARYVDEHGGALLVAAGDDYASAYSIYHTPLSSVLPAAPTGRVLEMPFRAKITPEGQKHPVTQGLPGWNAAKVADASPQPTWGHWFRQAEVTGERGRIVMTGAEDKPLLVLDRKGKGRVALLTSDQAWLWARGYDGGGPHTDLLRRLSHWLMKEPDLEEERLIASARGLKLTVERRSMDDEISPVKILGPGGDTTDVTLTRATAEPGVWRSTIDVKLPGLYKAETPASTGELTAVANAGVEDPREMSEVTATDSKMKPIADATGGGVFWTRTANGSATDIDVPRISMMSSAKVMAGSGWLGLKDRQAYLTRGVKLTPMFNGFAALAALLALIALAWWREGR
ncbi:protein of unknown function DUF1355 [Hyphomicrobium denitrificans ATCC 51888]|uniref:Glutamine amidotransferase domain-containing protein n=1 Tax=Hyphomicrobium denitrificans (strain ATCC 51888 / DSM 1869 / NCIMB 11706 / TK 0415) TaxID=582899 RepID=D8JRV9_HYPDA|nr:membrane protein [Hyphomicrobium denitrificans]ADJ24177.1 protein of unknown function DUF1355 [Hyphomicrobium denitrificans ATCC 51888]